MSMEQTRFRLLALSAVCPGASTLIGKCGGGGATAAIAWGPHICTPRLCTVGGMGGVHFTPPAQPFDTGFHGCFRLPLFLSHGLFLPCLLCCTGNLLRSSAVSPPEAQQPTLAGRKWLRSYVNGCAFQFFEVCGRGRSGLQCLGCALRCCIDICAQSLCHVPILPSHTYPNLLFRAIATGGSALPLGGQAVHGGGCLALLDLQLRVGR